MKQLFALAVLSSTFSLKAQTYTGLIGVQGPGIDRVLDVAFVPNGDLIIEGCFNQTVVFGDTTLVADIDGDTFVGRMDPSGQWLWVRNTGGQQEYYGQLIVDPAGDIIALVDNYRLLKLNGAGDELWVRDEPTMRVRSIALMDDEILVNGAFNFTTIFGPDTFTTANFYTDAFVGRISASTGEWIKAWHVRGNGLSDAEEGWGIAATTQGNMLFTLKGQSPQIYAGDDTLFSQGAANRMYVVEMDTSGHVLWWTSSIAGATRPPFDIRFTNAGDPVLLGRFYNPFFDYDGVTYTPPVLSSSDDGYILWLGANGALQNVVFMCGQGDQQGLDLEIDLFDNLYVTGVTCGSMTLGGTTLNDPSICNAFVAMIDATGNWQWAMDLSGPGNSTGYGVALAPDGRVCMGGLFATNDANAGAYTLTNAGNDDGFIAFVEQLGTGTTLAANGIAAALSVWPNPVHGRVRVSGGMTVHEMILVDGQGRLVRRIRAPMADTMDMDVSDLAPGLYNVVVADAVGLRTVRLCVE